MEASVLRRCKTGVAHARILPLDRGFRDTMSYRRDLLNIRVVVRPSTRNDQRADAPLRRLIGEPSMQSTSRQPAPHATVAAVAPIVRSDREPSVTPSSSASQAAAASAGPEVILVKSGFKHVAVRAREILFVEAARNYVRLNLENGTVLKSRVPIERLAQHLGTERFLRIHRGRLVNTDRVRSVTVLTGGRLRLTLSSGSTIVVARDRRRIVLAELGSVAMHTG